MLLFLFAAQAGAQALEAGLSVSGATLDIGEPLFVTFEVENHSPDDVLLPINFFTMNAKGRTGLYFSMVGPGGSELANSCSPETPSDIDYPLALAPGEYHGRRNIRLSDCFDMKPAGPYTLTAVFTSAGGGDELWRGSLKSGAIAITVRESEARMKMKRAALLVEKWRGEYELSSAMAYRRELVSLGTPAAPAVIEALEETRDYSMASDLLAVLGELPCRESGDALVEFMLSAGEREYDSDVPGGFSAAGMLSGAAVQAMEKLAGYDLMREKKMFVGADVKVLWGNWWEKNRATFPRAVPENM